MSVCRIHRCRLLRWRRDQQSLQKFWKFFACGFKSCTNFFPKECIHWVFCRVAKHNKQEFHKQTKLNRMRWTFFLFFVVAVTQFTKKCSHNVKHTNWYRQWSSPRQHFIDGMTVIELTLFGSCCFNWKLFGILLFIYAELYESNHFCFTSPIIRHNFGWGG